MRNFLKFFILALVFLSALSARAVYAVGPRGYITNYGSNNVSVFDSSDDSIITNFNVPLSPDSQALSPDGSRLYTINFADNSGNGSVSIIDTSNYSPVATIGVGNRPFNPALSPDGEYLYVPNYGENTVSVIDTVTGTLAKTITVGQAPYGVAVNHAGTRAYVGTNSTSTNEVDVIDTATNTVIDTIPTDGPIYSLAFSLDDSKVYGADGPNNRVDIIDTATNTVTGNIPMTTGNGVYAVLLNHAGTKLYASNNISESITVIDLSTNTVTDVIPVPVSGQDVTNMAITGDDSKLYTTDYQTGDTVAIIDTSTNTITSHIQDGGSSPSSISIENIVTPVGNQPPGKITTSNARINVGQTYSSNNSFSDPDSTSWTATVDYGDGSGSSPLSLTGNNFSLSHTYNTAGTYNLVISITDNQNATKTKTTTITVSNPIVNYGARAYVTNDASNTVSVIDTWNDSLLINIPVGIFPRSQVVSPDGSHVYVTNYTYPVSDGPGTVSVIDTVNYSVIATIPVGDHPQIPSISPDGSKVYVPNGSSGNVSVIDTATNSVIHTISVDTGPMASAISSNGSTLYVSNLESHTISVIDTSTNTVIDTIPVDGQIFSLALSSDDSKLYAADGDDSKVQVIDTSTNTVTTDIPMTSATGAVALALNYAGTKLYVTNNLSHHVSVIDTASDTVTDVIPVTVTGRDNVGIAVTPDDSKVYVTDSQTGDTVAVIDTATNTVVNYVQGGGNGPNGLSIESQEPNIPTPTPSTSPTPTPTPTPVITTLTPTADSFLNLYAQNNNEGAAPALKIENSLKSKIVIKFDQSQIAAAIGSSTNYTAVLNFTITSNGNNWGTTGKTIEAHRLIQDWTEGNGYINGAPTPNRGTGPGVTWNCSTDSDISNNNKNCTGGNVWDIDTPANWPFLSSPTDTVNVTNHETGTVSFNVTSDIQAFMNGSSNDGWIIKRTDETTTGKVYFGSRETSSTPTLVITAN